MAWNLLLTSDIGLLSLFTIVFMIGMVIFIFGYVTRHMKDDAPNGTGANTLPNAKH